MKATQASEEYRSEDYAEWDALTPAERLADIEAVNAARKAAGI